MNVAIKRLVEGTVDEGQLDKLTSRVRTTRIGFPNVLRALCVREQS